LDSEDEGIFTAGCAGGGRIIFSIPVSKVAPRFKKFFKLTVKGLKGGHSGMDIDKERGNSIKILGRILYDLNDNIDLLALGGGSKANAIPRESWAILAVSSEIDMLDVINQWNITLKNELKFSDADVSVTIAESDAADLGFSCVYSEKVKDSIIHLVNTLSNGPMSRNPEQNIVEYSNNLGILSADDRQITLTCSVRSSISSLLHQYIDVAEQLAEILQINVEVNSLYPGWEYAKESPIRDLCLKTYEELYGIKGKVNVIHAGLECGYIMEKLAGLDTISMGPNMYDVHTPDEHLSISSTGRTFRHLCEVLKRIK
jgi:dipeptidase D